MKAMRIRTDDHVMVTAGKDKGKQGKVIRVDPKRRRVFVEGVNIVKRHQRPRSRMSARVGTATPLSNAPSSVTVPASPASRRAAIPRGFKPTGRPPAGRAMGRTPTTSTAISAEPSAGAKYPLMPR